MCCVLVLLLIRSVDWSTHWRIWSNFSPTPTSRRFEKSSATSECWQKPQNFIYFYHPQPIFHFGSKTVGCESVGVDDSPLERVTKSHFESNESCLVSFSTFFVFPLNQVLICWLNWTQRVFFYWLESTNSRNVTSSLDSKVKVYSCVRSRCMCIYMRSLIVREQCCASELYNLILKRMKDDKESVMIKLDPHTARASVTTAFKQIDILIPWQNIKQIFEWHASVRVDHSN